MHIYFIYLSGLRFEDAKKNSSRYQQLPLKIRQSKRSGPKWVAVSKQFKSLAATYKWEGITSSRQEIWSHLRSKFGYKTHSLRHAHNTHSGRYFVQEKQRQRMQWKDPQMLKRYTHNEEWEEQAIVDDLSFSALDKFIETDHVRR